VLLSRDAILSASDLPTEDVEVPEWGGSVRVRTMTGAERDQLEGEQIALPKGDQARNFRARLVVRTACDEAGASLFTVSDVNALAGKSAAALDRVFTVATRLNGMSKTDVEELEKNS
jgi:hypothetical protein